jgi:alpha-glucosidase
MVVIYQIYPRSFADKNGDGIGDLQGIISRLDYNHDLGVGCDLAISSLSSPMVDFGYDVTDYCDIDPIFGNLQVFDKLVEEAHSEIFALSWILC